MNLIAAAFIGFSIGFITIFGIKEIIDYIKGNKDYE